jgi:signal transduction histidine kinase
MSSRPSLADLVLPAIGLLVGVWAVVGADSDWRLRVLLLAIPLTVAMAVSRRWPVLAVAASLAAMFLTDGAGEDTESALLIALLVSCFTAGRYARLSQLPWVGAGTLVLVTGTVFSAEPAQFSDAVFPVIFTAGPCGLGMLIQLAVRREGEVRAQAQLLDAMREEEVRRASAEERLRIARELHDLVAHDISALSLQTQIARRGVEAGTPVAVADLLRIEQTAQGAMHDIRRLLGLLHDADDQPPVPAPSLADLPGLVADAGSIGQEVELVEHGQPRPLAPALSQAVYRIAQEALTNARRHAADHPTTVRLDWGTSVLDVTVTNPLPEAPAVGPPGHGTVGISHRAEMFGGTATVGARGTEWRVAVRLPLPEQAPVSAVSRTGAS